MHKFLYFRKKTFSLIMGVFWIIPLTIWLYNIIHSGPGVIKVFNVTLAFLNLVFWLYIYSWLKNNYYLKIRENYLIINYSIFKKNRKYFYHNIHSLEKKQHTLILNLKKQKKVKISLQALSRHDREFMETAFITGINQFISA